MPLVLKGGAVFLHAPKTGGNWVTAMLQQQDLLSYSFGHKHADASHLLAPPLRKPSLSAWRNYRRAMRHLKRSAAHNFCYTVRNPFDWYESWFKYQSQASRNWRDWGAPPNPLNWHVNSPLNGLGAPDFSTFMERVTEQVPGYVTRLFGQYRAIGPARVLRNESLAQDLCETLAAFDVPHDADRILAAEKIGVSEAKPITWEPDLRQRVRDLDRAAFLEYGYALD